MIQQENLNLDLLNAFWYLRKSLIQLQIIANKISKEPPVRDAKRGKTRAIQLKATASKANHTHFHSMKL